MPTVDRVLLCGRMVRNYYCCSLVHSARYRGYSEVYFRAQTHMHNVRQVVQVVRANDTHVMSK